MRTLYLLPGLLCDAATFAPQLEALRGVYDVRVPDFFGFDSIPAMAASVLLGAPERFAVLGFSMGGRVALEVLRQAPERVTHLGLLATGAHPRAEGEEGPRKVLTDLSAAQGMAALAARWLPPMLSEASAADPLIMGIATAMVCRATPEIHARQIRALLNRPDASVQLSSISVPTLVVAGEKDRWATPAQHEKLAAAIPGAVLKVIEGSGHFVPLEAPAPFTAALRDWLAE